MAGASLWATRLSGKLNGAIAATTPTGRRNVKARRPSPIGAASTGTISPVRRRASTAAKVNVLTARLASIRAVLIGLAASMAIVRAKSSARSASNRAAASSTSARRHGGNGSSRSARAAAATARSTSAGPCFGTRPTSAPSYGDRTTISSLMTNSTCGNSTGHGPEAVPGCWRGGRTS